MEILLNKLNEIQEKKGYISKEEIIKLAKERDMPKAELYGVISFYSRLYTKPMGKYIIRVCKSVSCGINGSKKISNKLKTFLNINFGETTPNREFTLEEVECLGHCGKGPVITINDEAYEEMTEKKVEEIIKSYRVGEMK